MKQFIKAVLGTPFITLLWNLLMVYICFMICRIAFIWYNWDLYSGYLDTELVLNMLKGSLRFDTAGIMYLSILYIFLTLIPLHFKERKRYYQITRWILIVCCSIGIVMNLADTVYYQFSGKRTTISLFTEFANESNIAQIILKEVINSWYITLLGIALIAFLIKFIRIPKTIVYNNLWHYYLIRPVSFLLMGTLSVAGMRGGFTSSHPITLSNANQYVNRPVEAVAVLNTPFCFVRTLDKKQMVTPHYYTEEELNERFSGVITPDSNAVFTPKNVVVFILESFGTEYIGALNKDKPDFVSYTPFLDSLIEESLTFEYSFANGRKSIDAMPSILSGIPMFVENFVLTPTLINKNVSGLAEELSNKGYYSAFFHGADNSSMGFKSYSRSIGYIDYFGLTEFNEEPQYGGMSKFDGIWAIWDEDYLQYFCDKMGSFKQPFVSSIFTASSHHPFAIPEWRKEQFPEGNLPIHKCVKYSDNGLRLFFEKAKEQEWFNNTLFVFTADHTNQSEYPEYQTEVGKFRVPIIFYTPSGELKGRRNAVAQQTDILPTILGYLGYDRPFICFGQNLLTTKDEDTFAANYINGIFQFIKGDYVIHFDGNELMAMYNYKTDTGLKENLKDRYPDIASSLTAQLKAVIQQYMERMNEKSLVISQLP